nr:PREDICTED: cytoplasmic phosphatidylinositol transfer protein 1 [Lepisosteus oculatus]
MLLKEYRICMPLTVEEYRIGQLYMISKHSHEQSDRGEGVEVVQNEPYEDPAHGKGQFTEKRVYLNSKLPSWARAVVPKIFYVTEKAWNYYPYTITEYTCSFLPKFSIHIETKYEDNKGCNDHVTARPMLLDPPENGPGQRGGVWSPRPPASGVFDRCRAMAVAEHRSTAEGRKTRDELPSKVMEGALISEASGELSHPGSGTPGLKPADGDRRYYKESEDLRYFKSTKTSRGLLKEGWRDSQDPIMCSYKLVTVKFEVWGLQTRVEQFVHKVVRDVLLLGHRQAFAWVDEWIDMTMDEVREFERATQEATNKKIGVFPPMISISESNLPPSTRSAPSSAPSTPLATEAPEFLSVPKDRPRKKSAPETLTLPDPARKEAALRRPKLSPAPAPRPAAPPPE